jgi:hypothetical protein
MPGTPGFCRRKRVLIDDPETHLPTPPQQEVWLVKEIIQSAESADNTPESLWVLKDPEFVILNPNTPAFKH